MLLHLSGEIAASGSSISGSNWRDERSEAISTSSSLSSSSSSSGWSSSSRSNGRHRNGQRVRNSIKNGWDFLFHGWDFLLIKEEVGLSKDSFNVLDSGFFQCKGSSKDSAFG